MNLATAVVRFIARLLFGPRKTPADPPLPEFKPVARQPRRIHANAIKWEI